MKEGEGKMVVGRKKERWSAAGWRWLIYELMTLMRSSIKTCASPHLRPSFALFQCVPDLFLDGFHLRPPIARIPSRSERLCGKIRPKIHRLPNAAARRFPPSHTLVGTQPCQTFTLERISTLENEMEDLKQELRFLKQRCVVDFSRSATVLNFSL